MASKRSANAGGARLRLPAAERRRHIVAAAQKIFIRSGLNGARTREIADEAGVTEATLFSHFPSKEALFDAAVLEPLKEVGYRESEISREFASARDVESMRRVGRVANREMLAVMTKTFPLLITALFSDKEKGARFYRKQLYPILQKLAAATATALPKKVDAFDAELIALASFGIHFMILMDHTFRKVPLDVERTITAVPELLMSGFLKGPLGREPGRVTMRRRIA